MPALIAPAAWRRLVVPVCGAWAWGTAGWLRQFGFIDIGGASVLHVVGGLTALIGAVFVGGRSGKYNRDGSTSFIPGHNIPMASVGVVLMLAAWTPYISGASMLHGGLSGHLGLNVLLAASAGAMVELLISQVRVGGSDVLLTYSGLLGGLVAMTAGGGAVSTMAAVLIGRGRGAAGAAGDDDDRDALEDRRSERVDRDSIRRRGVGDAGDWFVFERRLRIGATSFNSLASNCSGLATIAITAGALAIVMFALLRKTIGLRLSSDAEYDGADLSEHDLNAYPDFQQNMIKSYHLREG